MSWSASFGSRAALEMDDPSSRSENANAEQYNLARRIAKQIIESGAIGDEHKGYTITISGHANPGHEPAPGMSTDGINVTVFQQAAAP
jgi:hypothetical protein